MRDLANKKHARVMRKEPTDAECKLWLMLKGRQLGDMKFRLQHPIGHYIADFACVERKLIIEADGGQHNENEKDEMRSVWLNENGWYVLRFWNNDILQNSDGVVQIILAKIEELPSVIYVPSPSHRQGAMGPSLSRKRERGIA